MSIDDLIKILVALAGTGTAVTGAVYGLGRYVRDLNAQIVAATTTAFQARLIEKDAIIAKLDRDNAELRGTVDRQTEASLKQSESQVALIAQQQQLIAAIQMARGSS